MAKNLTLTGAPKGVRSVRHNGKRFILGEEVRNVSDADAKALEGLAGHTFKVNDQPKEK